VEHDGSKARLLLLYTDAAHAAALFQRLPGEDYEVISCPVSAPVDGWMEELQPDLILLDPPPEQKQLLKTCEALRAQTERPIVVLSERSEELLVARVLAAGIDEYLVQPIGERELTARIEAMLRRMRRYGGPAQTNQLGGMILSSSDLSAELDGRRTFLSPIEFRLLACLASAPGKVLTHQTLMARVWGAEYVDSRHYLRLYIRYLREKLEEDPAQPQMILSEWGVGYRFQPPEPSRR
jgi:two-component system KDP operon response regulator KdpE